ncbi:MAG: penicillin-binding protein 2 [candidate division WOR-3 bacterium]
MKTPKILIISLAFVLILRLLQLQIIQKDYYRTLSERNRIRREILLPPRGRILSREGDILADSRPSFSLTIYPRQIHSLEIEKLCDIFKMDKEEIARRINPNFSSCKIKRVSFEIASKIIEKQEEFPSVRLITEPVRFYENDRVFSHLIGYAGEITEEELKLLGKDYMRGDVIGKKGVELQYEDFLRGERGAFIYEVDARGVVVKSFDESYGKTSEKGYDVYLTVSKALTIYVDSLFSEYQSGACVAMNPKNGEIILYYSKPGYKSNRFAEGISKVEWDSLREDEKSPLWDRVIAGAYPPGSIAKIWTTLIALENKLINKESTFHPCDSILRIGNRYFGCWKPHGTLRLIDAIIQSCDIYFYQVGMLMSLELIADYTKKLGFNQKTGIDLPGERIGFFPTREWYNKKYGGRGWSKGVLANLAIGQGEVLITPIQGVTFFSAVANGGWTYNPHILKEVKDREGNTVARSKPKKIELPVSKENLEFVKEAMKNVVNTQKGTAYRSRLENIMVAGKTGTAQNPHGEDHSLFVGFAPFEDPEIVVFTVVENAGHGSAHAAPITTKVIKRYLEGMKMLNKEEEKTGIIKSEVR